MSKTSIIIHGHFYQPPRENPYTGIVPVQTTAKPYSDWNQAIFCTCYRPNAASRYLSYDGKVERIYNNYSRISVNMGQTLLDWIDGFSPDFMARLRKADEESRSRFGHSSFIAQGFNHTILPLDNEGTKRIQVEWAIESYRARFLHDPEGFWLAECAINNETVDVLASCGIKFVILAPWQGIAIDGKSTNGKHMPCDRPFIIEGRQGSKISAFFYNSEFAGGVSFGHMLRDADTMFKRLTVLRQEMREPALISWATDGEIYGHHEPFGDMGLAALIRKIEESEDFQIDNFASFLERHPATETATLGSGDDGKGTSWSCIHGVGRWSRNCGCHTGGDETWNQRWRAPLRGAFNNLEKAGRSVIDQKVREIMGQNADYKSITLSYKSVVSHQKTVEQFTNELVKENGKNLSHDEKQTVATLLEAFRNIMFSYTSCGWFFNDISGLEPRQNISYAVYAATLLDRYTDKKLLESLLGDLEHAKSNIATEGTGADIAKRDIPQRSSLIEACIFFAMNRRFADPSEYTDTWGIMKLVNYSENRMSMLNTKTLQMSVMDYSVIKYFSGGMGFVITEDGTKESFTADVLKTSEKSLRAFTSWVENRLISGFPEEMIDNLALNIGNYLALVSSNRDLFRETVFTENIGSCIKAIKSLILAQPRMDIRKRALRIRELSYFVKLKGRRADIQDISDAFTKRFSLYSKKILLEGLDFGEANDILLLLETALAEGFAPDSTDLQDVFYMHLNDETLPKTLRKRITEDLNFKG
ncbi:MAG: DUF3536 domain-containing protein [Spirochaetales bacterium]